MPLGETIRESGEIDDIVANGSEISAQEHEGVNNEKTRAKAKFEQFIERLYKIEPGKNLYDLDKELQAFFVENSNDKNMVNLPDDDETAYDWFSSDYEIDRIVAEQNNSEIVTVIAFLKQRETDHSEVYKANVVVCVDMTTENGEWLIKNILARTSFKTILPDTDENGSDSGAYLNISNKIGFAKEQFVAFLQRRYQINKGENIVNVDRELLRFFSNEAYNEVPFVTGRVPDLSDAPTPAYGDFSLEYEVVRLVAERNDNGSVSIASVLKVTKTEITTFDITVVICVDMKLENNEWLIYNVPICGEYGEEGDVQI
jgi:hypothetical protein